MHGQEPADRFRDLIRRRLLPGLAELGFEPSPGVLASCAGDGVRWLLDIELAPWTNPDRICFAAAWGVHVPGLAGAMGEPEPLRPTIAACPVHGLLSRSADGREPTWFQLGRRPWPLSVAQDVGAANSFLGAVVAEALPRFEALADPGQVQAHVFAGLVGGRGAAGADELQAIARIAALSHLLGDRPNALRWLDHLWARSCASMAPDVVEARLAPFREIVLAS
jgi:hypothetical protein